MDIKTVGVIGAGVMGIGVAQNLAQTNHQVILIDIAENILEKAKQNIRNNIRFQGFFNKKNIEKTENVLPKILFTSDYQLLKNADFVVENVVEKWDIKKDVYAQIDVICPEHCIFAANTSAIPITRIGSITKRPAKVIGMHFMNPVPMKKMVETIRGYHTSDETIEIAKKFLSQMGKDCIIINDAPGFVANRLSHLFMNEAANLVMENVATPKDIDDIFKKCYGHAMGPLETADLIGLDTVVDTLQVLYENYQDSKFRCSPLLKRMVDAGLYGQKSGKGFYTYQH
ncbi:3-hydroxyacyl-CoA dehydrogenase [Thioploca ingrica]|uniref:3-hydroxyacyl-CoA dehydrogenase n=1 Tax=Thioploca ingrica TaxID=40754 RepID=A0A090BVA2_9GAMM|nr:3-hydroxyacyl-CoA dehydrogenase [Thioploca ingrica]